MEIKEVQSKKSEVVTDILCDICGKSCKVDETTITNPFRPDKGEKIYDFSCIRLEKYWGYGSARDEEYWEAQICDKCIDEHLVKIIKFNKFHYNIMNGSINKNKPITGKKS